MQSLTKLGIVDISIFPLLLKVALGVGFSSIFGFYLVYLLFFYLRLTSAMVG